MRYNKRTTTCAALWAAFVALAGSLAPAGSAPLQAASAMSTAPAATAAPAAVTAPAAVIPDPSDEIVYISAEDDLIRVLDLFAAGNEVKWISPEGDFREVALGDVNNDGDMEVIGIKGDNPNGEVVIYDPVIASGDIVSGQKINDIPWALLARVPVAFTPTLILAGNFDANVAGDEFVVGGIRPGNPPEIFELGIYKNKTATSAGKEWDRHVGPKYFNGIFSRGAVGNVIVEPAAQTDEFAMINEDGGVLMAYSTANGFDNILTIGDADKKFKDVVIGQWSLGTQGKEIIATRDAALLINVFYWEFTDLGLEEKALDPPFNPPFRRITATDVNNSGDDEVYLMRDVSEGVDLARLISRNSGSDGAHEFEEDLNSDNRWRALTQGDVNGDDKGDVIIASEGAIRVYQNAARSSDDYIERNLPTNRRSIVAGNLDAMGYISGPEFVVNPTAVVATAGTGSATSATLKLKNSATPDPVPWSISAEGNPAWLAVNGRKMNTPPATGTTAPNSADTVITLDFDAQDLPAGVYRSRLFIDSTAQVSNKPVEVVVTFNVRPADFALTPSAIYAGPPCTGTVELTHTVEVAVSGLDGVKYTAAVLADPVVASARAALGELTTATVNEDGTLLLGNSAGQSVEVAIGSPQVSASAAATITWPSGVPWVSAWSQDGILDDTLTVTALLAGLNNEYHAAWVVLFGDSRAGSPPDNMRLLPVFACSNRQYLPKVIR